MFTDRAGDGWGIAAMSLRSRDAVDALRPQDGLFSLVVRGQHDTGDRYEVVQSLSALFGPEDVSAVAMCARPEVGVVTVTVPEAEYRLAPGTRRLDSADPEVVGDASGRRPIRTMPGWVLLALDTRRRAGAGSIAVVSCDPLSRNGELLGRVVLDLAQMADPSLAAWVESTVTFPSTVVERAALPAIAHDRDAVEAEFGLDDQASIVAEPFAEWVLEDQFPAGRPAWEHAGAQVLDDIVPHEHRNLRLAYAGLSALAYLGLPRGAVHVAEAMDDTEVSSDIEGLLTEAVAGLPPAAAVGAPEYVVALLERWSSSRVNEELVAIAANGSLKLTDRLVPTVLAARSTGGVPRYAARVLAAWVVQASGHGRARFVDLQEAKVRVLASGSLKIAVPAVLGVLDPALAEDTDLCLAVATEVASLRREFDRRGRL